MRSWHLFKHGIAKGRTRALWDRHLDSSQLFRLLLRLQLFGSITLNIFVIQTLFTVMQLFKGSYIHFSVDAASRHFWPNSAIANGTTHVFMSCVSPASRQSICIKDHIFSKLVQWNNNWYLDMDFNSKYAAYKLWF